MRVENREQLQPEFLHQRAIAEVLLEDLSMITACRLCGSPTT